MVKIEDKKGAVLVAALLVAVAILLCNTKCDGDQDASPTEVLLE